MRVRATFDTKEYWWRLKLRNNSGEAINEAIVGQGPTTLRNIFAAKGIVAESVHITVSLKPLRNQDGELVLNGNVIAWLFPRYTSRVHGLLPLCTGYVKKALGKVPEKIYYRIDG